MNIAKATAPHSVQNKKPTNRVFDNQKFHAPSTRQSSNTIGMLFSAAEFRTEAVLWAA